MSIVKKTEAMFYKKLKTLWRSLPLSTQRKAAIKKYFIRPPESRITTLNIPVIEFDATVEGYVAHAVNPPINPAVKLIAFYLPQFHPFAENDQWWGKGFTEWYNVGRAEKNYSDHYQPHCPIHNGYYDLRIPSVMEEQAHLAKQYGVHGFSYYFYWFAGKILMDTPLEMMLSNPNVDIPFCLTWANESWTRRWDGQDNDVLISQEHSAEDSIAFIQHLVKYFKDPRYVRIDDKPVLIIYRADIIPDIQQTAGLWRDEVKKHGIPDLYLICAQSFGIRGPEVFNFDASVEFPPHTAKSPDIQEKLSGISAHFTGQIFDYNEVVAASVVETEPRYKLFRSAMLSWDNTARKQNNSHIFHDFSLLRYKQWLSALCSNVFRSDKYPQQEKLVFINAWNEWAEGTHLEPDRKYGYGYLQATYDVISCYDQAFVSSMKAQNFVRKNDHAVILHVHYPELWPELKMVIENLAEVGADLFVTTTNKDVVGWVHETFPSAVVEYHENRGRDIFPFTKTIEQLCNNHYLAVCKLHTKRSTYRQDGDHIRSALLNSLLGDSETIKTIVNRFDSNPSLGMVVPENYLITHTAHNMTYNHETVSRACTVLDLEFEFDTFPAGSMFWFKPEALRDLSRFESSDFDIEQGLADGTLPHAIERIFCLLAKKSGFTVETC